MSHSPSARIAKNAIMLALLCTVGMFSIPFGENVKVSLQLLMVFIIALTATAVYDAMVVTVCYTLMGLFLPIYAGFSTGVTPTFGYVLSFTLICPILFYMNRIPKIHPIFRMALACLCGLLVTYAIGTIFMMVYLQNFDLGRILLVSVVPYLPFDALKIALAILIVEGLPSFVSNHPKKTSRNEGNEGK